MLNTNLSEETRKELKKLQRKTKDSRAFKKIPQSLVWIWEWIMLLWQRFICRADWTLFNKKTKLVPAKGDKKSNLNLFGNSMNLKRIRNLMK